MKRRLLILCLLVVFMFGCLGLSGCTLKNETLDQQMSLVVAALNEGDEAAFAALLYPGMEEEMFSAIVKRGEKVVKDGRIITGQAAGSSFDFGLKLVELLKGAEAAEKVRHAIHYND